MSKSLPPFLHSKTGGRKGGQIMEYNIFDLSNWKDESEFTKKLARLVEGLGLFYKEQARADG